MELQTYIEKYLGTLYLQHRSKMEEPINEKELVMRVREGIAEDTRIELTIDEVERLINAHVPASWRSLSPSEADAQWLNEVRRKEEET